MNNKTVLVIGSGGQLGSEMIKFLRKAAYSVAGVDYPQIDITNRKSVREFVNQIKPWCIINCAAFTAVDDCESHPDTAFAVNARGPENLAISAEENGALLVHISTDYVFDGKKSVPYIESDITNPMTVYGKSKLEGERLVAENCSRHQIFRIAWLYGLNGNNFVKAIRNAAIKKKTSGEPLKVVNDQTGTPTSAIEVCRQVLNCLESGQYGIFHSTCEGSCTWYDFAREVLASSGIDVELLPCTTEEFPRPAPRPRFSVLENARLKSLGLNTMPDWKKAFANFIEDEKKAE
ncbi:MAG TPA: dTDP-4-dehydrorhamnose reductase [Chitinispirillaceae bacterium]|jgi:dTDP-4-dehydrorhamnose reductase|nr:dTDP-4-dehydrorhamnose reductase [Chitinispirillaceae bacterium]